MWEQAPLVSGGRTFFDGNSMAFCTFLWSEFTMPQDEPTCKVREKPAPYNCKKRPSAPRKDTPKTSARPITTHHQQNLTMSKFFLVVTHYHMSHVTNM